MSVSYDVTNTLRAQMKHHEPIVCYPEQKPNEEQIACYAPTRTNCESYKESSMSATLCTKHHYGTGGDAALVVTETGRKKEPIAFIERAGCEGGVRVSLSPPFPER